MSDVRFLIQELCAVRNEQSAKRDVATNLTLKPLEYMLNGL